MLMKTRHDIPEWLAKQMVAEVETDSFMQVHGDSLSILVPSAGAGAVPDQFRYWLRKYITLVEPDAENYDTLRSKDGYREVIHGDFLSHDFGEKRFDYVVAVPPFDGNVDVEHITKICSLLKRFSKAITLTSPVWTVNDEPHQVAFRKLMSGMSYDMHMLPDGTIVDNGRSVPVALMKIYNSSRERRENTQLTNSINYEKTSRRHRGHSEGILLPVGL